jgi:CBS domain-containing protein
MICPSCGEVNLPGADECHRCLFDLAPLDLPTGHDRIEVRLLHDLVWQLKPKPAITVQVNDELGYALQVLVEKGLGAVLVTDTTGALVGILTERDYLNKVVGVMPGFHQRRVAEVMTHSPETISPYDTLALALQKMDVGGYRHLPVVEDRIPVGVISVRNLLKYITRLCKEPGLTS